MNKQFEVSGNVRNITCVIFLHKLDTYVYGSLVVKAIMTAEQVQLTGKAPERSFQNTLRVPFRA